MYRTGAGSVTHAQELTLMNTGLDRLLRRAESMAPVF